MINLLGEAEFPSSLFVACCVALQGGCSGSGGVCTATGRIHRSFFTSWHSAQGKPGCKVADAGHWKAEVPEAIAIGRRTNMFR
jgi:hypothetical protein